MRIKYKNRECGVLSQFEFYRMACTLSFIILTSAPVSSQQGYCDPGLETPINHPFGYTFYICNNSKQLAPFPDLTA